MTVISEDFSRAGRQEKSGRKFLPARARVNLQNSLSPLSPCHPEAGYLRCKSQLLAMQKSVTYDAKVRDLRHVIHWLTNRTTSLKPFNIKQARHLEVIPNKTCKRAYEHQSKENLLESMSNHEQVWATMNCPSPFPYLCNVVQRYSALSISKIGEDIWWNRLFNMPCNPNQQAVPHYSKL